MYNGQPPFPGAPNLPPFPPSRPPNANGLPPPTLPVPPGGFPPFRPPPAGFMPPFAPSFPPGSRPPPPTLPVAPSNGSPAHFPPTPHHPSQTQTHSRSPIAVPTNAGLPLRPPPTGLGIPQRPSHPGLGLGASGSPGMGGSGTPGSAGGGPPGFVRDVKTTSVFVGSIAPGIRDETLQDLLNACGPLHELKRISNANGKPQAFGFASFENPEVVLRAIRCLNGVELPDLTPEGRREGKVKALLVKADQKTQEFLEEFESTLGRSDNDEEADAVCRKAVKHIVALLTDPNAQHPDGVPKKSGGLSPIEVIVPAHLQDLKEGDLPEGQRVVVLDQIAIFRENAARREKEKKQIDEERERFKASGGQNYRAGPGGGGGGTTGYGYGNRGLGKVQHQAEMRQWGQQGQQTPQGQGQGQGQQQSQGQGQGYGRQTPQNQTPQTPHSQHQHQQNGAGPSNSRDPQGYDKPVAFVRAETAEAKADSGRTDEEEEELRRQRRQREKDLALRDAERRTETRERGRIEALNRELGHRKAQAELAERTRRRQEQIYENYNDEEIAEKGRELFYSDRERWRTQRAKFRTREYQDDVRDRQLESDELAALEKESEEFFKRQMAELAQLEEEQRARGLLTEDAAPIKLALSLPVAPAQTAADVKVKEEKKPGVAFAEDEEDEAETKRKRTFVRLDEDDEQSGKGVLSEAQKMAKRNARLLEIKSGIPKDKRGVWRSEIEWAALGETTIREKIRPFVHTKITDFLGELDQDLADFVLEHLKEKKGAQELVDGLEPILAEDAESFVLQLWRQLAFESAAYVAGLDTGIMMV